MSKKNGIITLLVMLAVLVGGIYASIYGIDSNGSGSAANIKQGLDLAGGVSITYQVECSSLGHKEVIPPSLDVADTTSLQRLDLLATFIIYIVPVLGGLNI